MSAQKLISPTIAEEQSFRILSGPYSESEHWMVANVMADMRRGGIPAAVVSRSDGDVEVWRTTSGFKELTR